MAMLPFDPTQRQFLDDESRVLIGIWHRQKGKDETTAAKAVRHALKTGQDWFIISVTQRQSDATFAKCRRWGRATMEMLRIHGEVEESAAGSEQWDKEIRQAFQFTARTLRLPGGGSVTSLPGRDPDTLAGLTGNVIFTEFGLFPGGGFDHWRVVWPLTTRGYQVVVLSTPRGKNTKLYELFRNDDGAYKVSFCDIHRSIAEDGFILRDNAGQPTDLETFKKLYGDSAGFRREYECQFTGDLSALIAWAELERAAAIEPPAATGFVYRHFTGLSAVPALADVLERLAGKRLAIGWDVARRRDLSAVPVNVLTPGKPSHLAALVTMADCTFEVQRGVVSALMDAGRSSVGFGDATGLGMESNEVLQKRYRDRWTPFTFTATNKRAIASALKTAFADGMQSLPPIDGEHKFVHTDLYAIQKDDTGANLVLDETENPLLPESHCDIAYGLGLARLAGAANVRAPLPPPRMVKPEGWR